MITDFIKKVFLIIILEFTVHCINNGHHKIIKKDIIGTWLFIDSAIPFQWYYRIDSVNFMTSYGDSVWKATYSIDDSNHFIIYSQKNGKTRIDTTSLEFISIDTFIWRTKYVKQTMCRFTKK